jgi:hypothetical protein
VDSKWFLLRALRQLGWYPQGSDGRGGFCRYITVYTEEIAEFDLLGTSKVTANMSLSFEIQQCASERIQLSGPAQPQGGFLYSGPDLSVVAPPFGCFSEDRLPGAIASGGLEGSSYRLDPRSPVDFSSSTLTR